MVMSNEETIAHYINSLVAEHGDISLNPHWVMKMLLDIRDANSKEILINPDYLRAEKQVWFTGQPMPEKDWIFRKDDTCAGDHVGSGLW